MSKHTPFLMLGDCLQRLRELPDNSIDSIVTDPPYELGFMGKKWDASGIANNVDMWREALRVLKPGGHLLAFGATRTYHRMTCAIEDAGFEIRDSIHWLYGCLTDDAEILTADGWKRGIDVRADEVVAAWDHTTSAIKLEPVQEKIVRRWEGPLVRFVNDDTDQLLTPNHRVYHLPRQREMVNGSRRSWYGADWQVAEAGSLSRWNPVKLPMAGLHDGPGIGGADYAALLGWVWTEGGFDREGTGIRIYQSESANPDRVAEIEALVTRLVPGHKRYDRMRTYTYKGVSRPFTETCWFFSGDMACKVRNDLKDKHPTWPLLWQMTIAEKRAFWDASMKGDGSGDNFYQKSGADLEWAQALVATIGYRGKIAMRKPPRDGGSLCITPRESTELQARHLKNDTESYSGDVWCVRVPSGAFVARRKGKVFITGNSGFPKSLDVSKAIDKAAGAEREVIGEYRQPDGSIRNTPRTHGATYAEPSVGTKQTPITVPATDAARQWQGWGTALKPAHEPIVMARKPLAGTVADNVMRHGTGALNIDACRIATDDKLGGGRLAGPTDMTSTCGGPEWDRPWMHDETKREEYQQRMAEKVAKAEVAGRWPANVVLSCPCANDADHLDGCSVAELDRQSGITKDGVAGKRSGVAHVTLHGLKGRDEEWGSYGGGGGASRFFYVAKPSGRERDAGLDHLPIKSGAELTDSKEGQARLDSPRTGAGRNGGRRNIHPTVKPVKLMRYLVRMVTPLEGIVLDPFLGSGTTGVAAVQEGFRFCGIEMDADYLEIARARIDHALKDD